MSSQGGGSSLPAPRIGLTPTPSLRPPKTSAKKRRKLSSSIGNGSDKASKQDETGWKVRIRNCRPKFSHKYLASMSILHAYPNSIAKHFGFQIFFSSLNPVFKVGKRDAIKDDAFKIYNSEKAKFSKLLDKLQSRIAITANMWTSGKYKGYMAITARFIDDDWKLRNRMLRFIDVPVPHGKEVLADVIMNSLLEWKVDHKVSTITVAFGRTDDGIIDILKDRLSTNGSLILNGKRLQMLCWASVLNLIVKDGLDVIGKGTEKIRDSVLFWSAAPERIATFEEVARKLCIPRSNNLGPFSKTRCDSTYLMLQMALPFKDVFIRLKQCEELYTCVPSEEEWRLAQEICDKLKEIYSVIKSLSGTTFTTANRYFHLFCTMRLRLGEWVMNPSRIISEMASDMIHKLEKYWSGYHMMVEMAVVLDPRYKMKLVQFYYQLIYGQDAKNKIEKVRQLCYDLLHEYDDRLKVQNAQNSDVTSLNPNSMVTDKDKLDSLPRLLSDFYLSVEYNRKTEVPVDWELDRYLDEKLMPLTTDFDVLHWWKINGIKFPILEKMARDIMAIPVSTVASKLGFTTRDKVVSTQCSRLKPEVLEALLCAKDWLWDDMAGTCSTENHGVLDADDFCL